MLRVGLVPFLNVAPFWDIPYKIIFAPPAELNKMMRNQKLDVAFCSSIEYLYGNYERVSNLGLAAHGQIKSVNLYLKGEIDQAHIRLDPKSEAANALLKILCPNARFSDSGDSFLIIGDEALRKPHVEGFRTIDLAQWWFEKTALPFVFALFIKQKGIDSAPLEKALLSSLSRFTPKIEALAKEHHFPKKTLIDYFSLCHYKLGLKDEQGLNTFYDCQRNLHNHCI